MSPFLTLGYFLGSIFLIQVHFIVILCLMITGYAYGALGIVFHIMAIIYGIVALVAHIKISVQMVKQFTNPSFEPKFENDELSITKNHMVIGLAWRLKNEWQCMKRIASFNFKQK